MKIVIDIDNDLYTRLFDNGKNNVMDMRRACVAVRKGVVIPDGHGRLIDVDEVVKEICIEHKANSIYELPDKLKSFVKKYLNEAPTILEPTPEYMIKNYAFSKSKK